MELIDRKLISKHSKCCFVDDGSADNTWQIIDSFSDEYIIGLKLSRNFGHQFALLAGLETFKDDFDAFVTMDVDLQDDIDSLDPMIESFLEGSEIVYGIREDRTTDSYFKRKTAELFYSIMIKLGVRMHHNHADYRLISKKALVAFLKFKEAHLFLRGVFPLVGFKHAKIFYSRKERILGESKYPLKKMLSFAWEGVTSFSDKPIRFVLNIGLLSIFLSIILTAWSFFQLANGNVIPGWTSTVILIIFFGGVQTFSLGLIGEYVGKIYMQTKERPRYIVDKIKTNE